MLDLNWTVLWGPHTQTHCPHRDDKLPYWPLLDSYNHKAHSVIYERDSPTPSLSLLPQKEREKERDAQDTKDFAHGTEWWYIDLFGKKKIYIIVKKKYVCVCACVCVCAQVFVANEDIHLYDDTGMSGIRPTRALFWEARAGKQTR